MTYKEQITKECFDKAAEMVRLGEFIAKHCDGFRTLCPHFEPLAVCVYEQEKASEKFGADGWTLFHRDEKGHETWQKTVEGIRVTTWRN